MGLHADDVVEIQQLLTAYCHHMDTGNGVGVAGLFTDDGVLEIVDLMTSRGSDEITANCSAFPEIIPGGRHIVHNIWVEGDGDQGIAHAYLSNVIVGDKPQTGQTGTYRDEVTRTSQGWRFTHRVLTLDGPLF